MRRIRLGDRKLQRIAILDNSEGNINSVYEDITTGELFMESMLKGYMGYLYFKTFGENVLSFIEHEKTLEDLFEKGMNSEIYAYVFRHHDEEEQREIKDLSFEFACGGKYRGLGMYEDKIEEVKKIIKRKFKWES